LKICRIPLGKMREIYIEEVYLCLKYKTQSEIKRLEVQNFEIDNDIVFTILIIYQAKSVMIS